jgi:hypothetical protein
MSERERQRERERVLALFEEYREAPGTPLDASHFLDFLLAAPQRKRAVYDSAAGMRRLEAFIDRVQLEYSVCLSHAERHAGGTLEAFVERLAALAHSPRQSLAHFRAEHKAVFGWPVFVLGNLALLLPVVILLDRPAWAAGMLLVVAAADAAWFLSRRRYAAYRQQLHRQLLLADDAHRKQRTRDQLARLG